MTTEQFNWIEKLTLSILKAESIDQGHEIKGLDYDTLSDRVGMAISMNAGYEAYNRYRGLVNNFNLQVCHPMEAKGTLIRHTSLRHQVFSAA